MGGKNLFPLWMGHGSQAGGRLAEAASRPAGGGLREDRRHQRNANAAWELANCERTRRTARPPPASSSHLLAFSPAGAELALSVCV
jgi:hypothetical protein